MIRKVSWHSLSHSDLLQTLKLTEDSGLSSAEVDERRAVWGLNQIDLETRAHWTKVLARQFADTLIAILVIAALVSLFIGETIDAGVIALIVVLNGVLGFLQEWKAEKALEELQKMLSPTCKVYRDGHVVDRDSSELVPGDTVLVEMGDRIPADLCIVEGMNLRIDESLLTGESVSVDKKSGAVDEDTSLSERSNMAWMGTSATNGWARGLVVQTGLDTEFGRIATLTQNIERSETPLQRRLGTLGKYLGFFAVLMSILVAVAGAMVGKPILDMFMIGISLAVAIVPEGLPAVVTVTLALGIRRMVKKKALLRRLQAAETLGAATVICTDKTGTLTQNEMTVEKVWTWDDSYSVSGVGYEPKGAILDGNGEAVSPDSEPVLARLLETGIVCNHATIEEGSDGWTRRGEPTEAALIALGMKSGQQVSTDEKPVAELSFSSARKRMSVAFPRAGGGYRLFTKGAPEVVSRLSTSVETAEGRIPLDDVARGRIDMARSDMAKGGLRTLALAYRDLDVVDDDPEAMESELCFLGFVAMADPPRPEVPEAIERAATAGIKVVMITGDAPETATAIADRIGLSGGACVRGKELESLSDDELGEKLKSNAVFARTDPEHKVRIVGLLQSRREVAAMTGDGVNDAPALRKADIGIAMGMRGTDVAKGSADIVLTDDNFASIIAAVREGRRQYENIKKFVRYLLTSNTGELVAVLVNILTGGPLILLPVQILWMNLITDGLTAVALGLEPAEKDVMNRPPRDPDEKIIDRRGLFSILLIGLYIGIVAVILFHRHLNGENTVVARTVAFCFLVVAEKVNVFNFRSLNRPMLKTPFLSNPWLLVAAASMISLQVVSVYWAPLQTALHVAPLGLTAWLEILVLVLPVFIFPEAVKWLVWHGKPARSS